MKIGRPMTLSEMDLTTLAKRGQQYLYTSYICAVVVVLCMYEGYASFLAEKNIHTFAFYFLGLFNMLIVTASFILSKIFELAVLCRMKDEHQIGVASKEAIGVDGNLCEKSQ